MTGLRSMVAGSPVVSPRVFEQSGIETRGLQPDSATALSMVAAQLPVNPLQSRALYAETLAARIEQDETARVALWEAGRKWTFGYDLERRWTITDDLLGKNGAKDTGREGADAGPEEANDGCISAPNTENPRTASTEPGENNPLSFWTKPSAAGAGGRFGRGTGGSGGSGGGIGAAQTAHSLESPDKIGASAMLSHVSPPLKTLLPLAEVGGAALSADDRRPSGGSSIAAQEAAADLRSEGRLSGLSTTHGEWRGLGVVGRQHSNSGISVSSVDSSRLGMIGNDTVDVSLPTGDRSAHTGAQRTGPEVDSAEASVVEGQGQSASPGGEDGGDVAILQALERLPKLIHHISTYPLIVPVASPPLRILPARSSRTGQEYPEAGGGEGVSGIARSSPSESHFSGPWGGNYTEEAGRWGSGMWKTRDLAWDALGPLPRRTFGSGGMASIGEADALERSRILTTSSGSSLAVTHFSGSVGALSGGGGGGGRSITPDHGVHSGTAGVGWVPREARHPTRSSEHYDETERSRSRSVAGSRDSVDNSLDDERYERATTSATHGLHHHGETLLGAAGRREEGSATISGGGSGGVQEPRNGSGDLRQNRSMSVVELGDGRTSEVFPDAASAASGSGGPISMLRRKTSAVDDMSNETAATYGSGSVTQTPAEHQRSRGGQFSSAVETDAEREEQRARILATRFVDAYSAYLTDSLGFRVVQDAGIVTDKNDAFDKSRNDAAHAGSDGGGEARPSSPIDAGNNTGRKGGRQGTSRRYSGGGSSTTSHDSGCGGPTLARALLRLALPWTNSVAIVEVNVRGDWAGTGARATALARTNTNALRGTSEAASAAAESGDGGVYMHRRHQACLTEILTASIRMWTVDVVSPIDVFGYRVDSTAYTGESDVKDKSQGGIRGGLWPIIAGLPTLQSFRSMTPVGFEDGGNELPQELSRVWRGLRFCQSVNDFIVGQVWNSCGRTRYLAE